MAIDWTRGWSAEWRLFSVDHRTFLDDELVTRVDAASVERTDSGLLESASISVEREVGASFEPGYYRIVLTATQGGTRSRHEIATLHCTSSSAEVDRGVAKVTLDGRSVLWPASRRRLLAGTYAPRGVDGASWAADMLAECLAAPIELEGSFELSESVVFDIGTTYLDAAWALLDAGGCCLRVDGHGTVHVVPRPSGAPIDLSGSGMRMVMPKTTREWDISEVPNRYTAVVGGLSATATNDDPQSPVSTVASGGYADVVDTSPTLVDGESLAGYALRRLAEESVVGDSYGYEREWGPDVLPASLVSLPAAVVGGDVTARVSRQHLECGRGIVVTEEAWAEVALWQP